MSAQTQENTNQLVSREQMTNITEAASDMSDKAITLSKQGVEKSVEIAKEYPIHTAIGMGAVGFLAGILTHKVLK